MPGGPATRWKLSEMMRMAQRHHLRAQFDADSKAAQKEGSPKEEKKKNGKQADAN